MDTISNDDVKWLLELLQSESLAEIEVAIGDDRVVLRAASAVGATPHVSPGQAPPAPGAACDPTLPDGVEAVRAPMAGIFYRVPAPEAEPYAEPGDEVQAGDTIGLIEAMKLYNEISSHVHGRIVKFLVENEQHVEADEPLVLIEPLHSPT